MCRQSDLRLRKRDVIMPIEEEPMLTYTRTHAGQKRSTIYVSFFFFFVHSYFSILIVLIYGSCSC